MFDVGQAALGLSIDGVMKALQGVNREEFWANAIYAIIWR